MAYFGTFRKLLLILPSQKVKDSVDGLISYGETTAKKYSCENG
jgi:hypothetical protein